MKLSEKIRFYGFWLSDFIKGSPVRRHYSEIASILRNPADKTNTIKLNEYLQKILNHAINTTKYYSSLKSDSNLSDFPVVNKTIIREASDLFCSKEYSHKNLIPVVTSGSTGTPFKVFHDRTKKLRNFADTIFFAQRAGFQIGQRLIYMKIFAREKMKNCFHYWMQNTIPIDVMKLNDIQISNLIQKLENENSTFSFLGYSSALELVCKYLERSHTEKVTAKITSMISMSESLNDYTREAAKKYFGVPALSRYSNLENGIIAQEEPDGSGRYLFNSASYVLEILKIDSDEPAEPGDPGRIVITDLFNYGMPMVRYDTGDVGILTQLPDKKGKIYLSRIEGRQLDLLYDTAGNLISSYIVYKNMWQYLEIQQYQLIQESKRSYTFKINTTEIFKKEEQLINEFKTYLGQDAEFKIEYVTEIPLLASGKRRKIVNNFIKS